MSHKSISALILTAVILSVASPSVADSSSQQYAAANSTDAINKVFWFLDAPKDWPAQVMPGMRGGTEKLKSYIDNLIPILGTKDIILFANYKSVMGARGSNEENIGVGLRDLLFDEKLILGGNFFYDTRYTENRLRNNQLAFGLEGLTKWVDLRSNFYFPFSGKQLLTDDTTFVFRSRALDELDTYEEPLTGLDYEIGALIPCISEYIETRAFIGGYNYFPTYGSGLNGIKARFEIRPIKAFTIDIEIKKDNYNPTECFVEGFITIPLDTMNVFKIKNPFTEFTRYFSYNKGIRSLRERMVDRIVRDIDITTKNTPIVESKAHDLTYVDNSYAGTVQDGTSEHPYKTITGGIGGALGDDWIFVRGTATNYSEAVTLPSNYVLWGSGYNGGFQNFSVSGIYPVLDGTGLAGGTNLVTIKNNNTVMGMQIQNAPGDGIKFTDGTTLTGIIENNILDYNGHDGLNLSYNSGSMSGFAITDNAADYNTWVGIDLSNNSGSMTNFTVRGNSSQYNNVVGIDFSENASTGSMRNFTISGNNASNNTYDGMPLVNNAGLYSDFVISGNIANDNGLSGIPLYNNTGTMSHFTISGNTCDNDFSDGIMLSHSTQYSIDKRNFGTMEYFTISGNECNNSTNDNGIGLDANAGIMRNFIISDNVVKGNSWDGINLWQNNGTMQNFTISGNTVNNNITDGLAADCSSHGTMSNFTISGNAFNNNTGGSGINLAGNAGLMQTFVIADNTCNSNAYEGISLSTDAKAEPNTGTMSDFTISGNIITGNIRRGIDLSDNRKTISNFTFSRNTITGDHQDGILLYNTGAGASMTGINFGDGSAGGYNSIYGNHTSGAGYHDINNQISSTISARYNWWGQAGGPVSGQISPSGSADTANSLSSNPN